MNRWQRFKLWFAPAIYEYKLRKKTIKQMIEKYPNKYDDKENRTNMKHIVKTAAHYYVTSNFKETTKEQIKMIQEEIKILLDLDELGIFT